MQVSRINPNLSFGRSLRNDEIEEFTSTVKESKKLSGQTGHSIFIMPSTSLPQAEGANTDIGHLASKKGIEFIDYMHPYLDFNILQDLPSGEFVNNHYNGSSLALGDQYISPELLTENEYSSILTKDELTEIIKANNKETRDNIANFENILGQQSTQNKILKNAHERFKALDENSELKQRYNKFVKENESWLNFARECEPDSEFFKFKQFLASEHMSKGKNNLNNKGIKYCGDIAINFSDDEVRAFPKAFKEGHYIGVPTWEIPSINFDTILDETSDAHKLLKLKVQLAAKRFDVLRVDAAWNYVTPVITPKGETKILPENKKPMGDSIVKLIEKWVKEVKGDDFDLHNIIYEFDAGPDDFTMFENGKLIAPLKDRVKVYGSTYLKEGWGSNDAFLHTLNWSPDEFLIGPGNHDPQPLRQIAKGIPDICNDNNIHRQASINPLARILKLDAESLKNPVLFAKAKFAEAVTAKNNMFFFMDVFGREERFNEHRRGTETSFRYKVPSDYQKAYQNSLFEGFGFNIMDSLEKIFKANGLDKSNPELFAKIVKFKNILLEKETPAQLKEEVSNAAQTAAETINSGSTTKSAAKSTKSYKPLWITAGAIAVLGGAFTLYKTKFQKHEAKDDSQQLKLTA